MSAASEIGVVNDSNKKEELTKTDSKDQDDEKKSGDLDNKNETEEKQSVTNPFVILVGIENYEKSKQYESLDGVKYDINRMIHLWNDIYHYHNISLAFLPNINTNLNNNCNDIINKLDKYKQYLNFPIKKTLSEKILCDKQSFSDYLTTIVSFINLNQENDGLIFYYSGHGAKDSIILSNGESFPIRSIIDKFDAQQCLQLRNKPKIMIYDCCRGDNISQTYPVPRSVIEKTRGVTNNNCYDAEHHVNSGLAIIFSNFSGYAINDPTNGGYLTCAIEKTFKDDKLIANSDLTKLVRQIRRKTKTSSGKGSKKYSLSAQIVEFNETLEYEVYFKRA